MRTILFITDLYAGSRVPMLTGVREVCSQLGMHVEEIELYRIEDPIEKVIEYWKPAGCIIEGSGKLSIKSRAYASIPVVHIDPDDKILADPNAFTVTNDAEKIADPAVAELAKTECRHFAFVGWTRRVGWSIRRERRFCDLLKRMGRSFSVMNDTWTVGNKAAFASRLRPFLA